jgi:RepB DNA-primase N-terminal domain
MFVVEPAAPLRLLRAGYAPDDWVAVFLKSYATNETCQRVTPVAKIATDRFLSWLRARNAAGWNVYVSVNAMRPHGRSRTRDAVTAVRHVFLEADHDGSRLLANVAARADLPAPSYLLHTSQNRVHVFWRVNDFDIARVEALQKRLAREIHTDTAATSCAQTTRLPGFFNHKRTPSELVTMSYGRVSRVYTPGDFPQPPIREKGNVPTAQIDVPVDARLERARRYLAAIPPAIAGNHGDLHTFRACCRLVRGFALDDDQALHLLQDWNLRCQPPWTERELADKVARARRYGREAFGGMLSKS